MLRKRMKTVDGTLHEFIGVNAVDITKASNCFDCCFSLCFFIPLDCHSCDANGLGDIGQSHVGNVAGISEKFTERLI